MIRQLRMLSIVAALVVAAATAAAANTVELTLQIPITVTLPGSGQTSPAVTAGGLKPFDVSCAVGSNLGYATSGGAQGNIVGQSSTAIAGSKKVNDPTGKGVVPNPSATVIITYDDGTGTGPGGNRAPVTVNSYLCWVQWKDPLPTIAPIFVQGTLPQS